MQNYAKCKIMQNATQCKIMQSVKLCKLQRYARCQIMESAKVCRMQKYVRCKIMHVKINPMFCNDLSAKDAKYYLYLGQICTTLRTA